MSAPYIFVPFIFLLFWIVGAGGAADENSPGHWILVTPSVFRQATEPLCEHRRQEGFKVSVVLAEEIYRSKEPAAEEASAIRDYLHAKYTELEGPVYVVLVGAVRPGHGLDESALPSVSGQYGRMKNLPSDAGYGPDLPDSAKPVTLGRLPARTLKELEGMVHKIIRFEQSPPAGPWKYRLSIMAGNPGGETPLQKTLSELFMQMIGQEYLGRIHPFWCVEGFVHIRGSDFFVPDEQLPARAIALLEKGQIFSFYLGHSNPVCLGSNDIIFLTQKDWANLKISHLQGVFFTCGCEAAWLSQSGQTDGYALTAMRNPNGPVGVIGPYGKSYSAIGQLAFNGMLECLSRSEPPPRLGDYWQSVRDGIAEGAIEPLMFAVYDYVDGSKGKTTLEFQRIEHREMWMLLGDPAMRIPVPSGDIQFTAIEPDHIAGTCHVKGTAVHQFEDGLVQLTLEKSLRQPKAPADSKEETAPALTGPLIGVTGYANNAYILDKIEVTVKDGRFSGELKLPELTSPAEIIVRGYIKKDPLDAMCIQALDLRSRFN